jgi:nucleotide-binding universal stress UspA family protein
MPHFRSILFPVDLSDRSRAAAPFVLSIAQRSHARVAIVHAVQPPPPMYAGMNTVYPEAFDFAAVRREMEMRIQEFAAAELPKIDTQVLVEIGEPAAVILDAAQSAGADLIAMPTHGYGLFRRMLLGSVTAKVLHDARVPVWTSAHAPEPSHRAHPQPRHILVAIDLKPQSKHVLEFAIELAANTGATVEMVHVAHEGVITPDGPENQMRGLLEAAAREELIKIHEDAAADVEIVTDGGNIAHRLRELAFRKRIDLIVVGRGAIQSHFGGLKTNAYAIIREAPCPVVSV